MSVTLVPGLWLCPCGCLHGHCPAPGTSVPYLDAPPPPPRWPPSSWLPSTPQPEVMSQQPALPQRPWGPQRGLVLFPVLRPLRAQPPLPSCSLPLCKPAHTLRAASSPLRAPWRCIRSCSSVAESEPSWVTLGPHRPQVIQMQCNLERSEDKARWHVSGVGARGPGWGWGVGLGVGGPGWGGQGRARADLASRLPSSRCCSCWRTGCTGSSLTTCSQVSGHARQAAGIRPAPPLLQWREQPLPLLFLCP